MTKKATSSKMDKALTIFKSSFVKPMKDKSARQTAIARFQSKLDMQPTTAATYYGHCMKKVRDQQTNEALAKDAKGGKVWSTIKVSNSQVTSSGIFFNRKAAVEFNEQYQHDGVVDGVSQKGDTLNNAVLKKLKIA